MALATVGFGSLPLLVAPLLLVVIASPTSGAADDMYINDMAHAALPGCNNTCGDVNIPYPFGIGPNCSREGFEIVCLDGRTPVLKETSYEVQNISVAPESLARVLLPIAHRCYDDGNNGSTNWSSGAVEFNTQGVYRISAVRNELVIIGCYTEGFIKSNRVARGSEAPGNYDIYTGCLSYCVSAERVMDNQCDGLGCCKVSIPPGLTETAIGFSGYDHNTYLLTYSPCSYGFLVDREAYNFSRADLRMNISQMMPVWLDWAIRPSNISDTLTCADAQRNSTSYACKSPNSICVDVANNVTGYTCQCEQGYEGNPYLAGDQLGHCMDIDECKNQTKYKWYGRCENQPPGNFTCHCPRGTRSKNAKIMPCQPILPREAQIAIGVICGIAFIITSAIFMLMVHHRRKLKEFFERNGGRMLENISNIKIFTKEDLKQMTKNYSITLGKGGFGEVYMGTIDNLQQVAVKRSISVEEERKKEFANEVIIQSRISHRNVVKLIGCCLEVDIPMLVYEFAPKGSLYDVLHGTNKDGTKVSLSLGTRLDIAVDSAEGLSYMHSSTNHKILHGDVKSGNILLDENFIPKVSDFGTSRLLSIEKNHTMKVIGDINYIDPVYMKTGRLDEKSDVYSFGAVLLELITRKKPRYDGNNSLIINFTKLYASDKKAAAEMYDEEIASQENIDFLHQVGSIAVACLKDDMEDRPNMRQVAENLQLVRREYKQRHGSHHGDQVAHEIFMESPPAGMDAAGSGTPGYSPLLK